MSAPEWLDEAKRLREAGLGYQKIADRVGATHNVVYYWVKRAKAGAPRTCKQCGEEFRPDPYHLSARFCSHRCLGEDLRRRRQGRNNPNHKHGRRVGKHSRERTERFQSGQHECQHPDCTREELRLNQHHVIYEQHIRALRGDELDPRNALGLCYVCHSSHHRRGTYVVPLTALRDENYEFAVELMGEAAYYYLQRRYAGHDPRLDRIIQPEAEAA